MSEIACKKIDQTFEIFIISSDFQKTREREREKIDLMMIVKSRK